MSSVFFSPALLLVQPLPIRTISALSLHPSDIHSSPEGLARLSLLRLPRVFRSYLRSSFLRRSVFVFFNSLFRLLRLPVDSAFDSSHSGFLSHTQTVPAYESYVADLACSSSSSAWSLALGLLLLLFLIVPVPVPSASSAFLLSLYVPAQTATPKNHEKHTRKRRQDSLSAKFCKISQPNPPAPITRILQEVRRNSLV